MVMKIQVDPDKKFRKEFAKRAKKVKDLTIPLRQISQRWYQSNKSIFILRGPGKYADLTDRYKESKLKKLGFQYPILRGENRRIEDAITDPKSPHAFNAIINKKSLVLGVIKSAEFPYAASIMFGSKKLKLPARPYLFTGAEQIAPKSHSKSLGIYLDILSDYVLQVSGGRA